MMRTAFVVVFTTAALAAQSQAPSRTFEVVSVKPGRSVSYGILTFPGGRLTAYTSVRALIARAYGVKDYQIEGAPQWLGEEYFSVDGRAAGDPTPAEFNEMLKAMLADRFALRAHTSTRVGEVHSLVLARPDRRLGPALKPTSPECLAQIEARKQKPETPPPPLTPLLMGQLPGMPRCGVSNTLRISGSGATTISESAQPLSALVDLLTSDLSSPVVDRTGLEGRFDYVIEYEARQAAVTIGGRRGLDPNNVEAPRPTLRAAIERQLGLKLESVQGEIPILVIDAVERPTVD